MRKTTVKNLIHLLIISLPLLLLLIACIFPTKQIKNDYNLLTTTEGTQEIDFNQKINSSVFNDNSTFNYYFNTNENTLTYKYVDTNNVSQPIISSDKLTSYIGHNILLRYKSNVNFTSNFGSTFYMYWQSNNIYYGITFTEDYYLGNFTGGTIWIRTGGEQYLNQTIIIELFDLTQMGLDNISYNDFINLFPANYYYVNSQIITLDTLTNNYGENILQIKETKQPNELILTPFKEFYGLDINSWYTDVLNLLNIDLQQDNIVKSYILYYPLWLMWFYLFELIELIITAVPRIIIKITGKIGGGSDV